MALAQGQWEEMCHFDIWRNWQHWEQERLHSQWGLNVTMAAEVATSCLGKALQKGSRAGG